MIGELPLILISLTSDIRCRHSTRLNDTILLCDTSSSNRDYSYRLGTSKIKLLERFKCFSLGILESLRLEMSENLLKEALRWVRLENLRVGKPSQILLSLRLT